MILIVLKGGGCAYPIHTASLSGSVKVLICRILSKFQTWSLVSSCIAPVFPKHLHVIAETFPSRQFFSVTVMATGTGGGRGIE